MNGVALLALQQMIHSTKPLIREVSVLKLAAYKVILPVLQQELVCALFSFVADKVQEICY